MNKIVLVLIAVGVIVIGGVAYYVTRGSGDSVKLTNSATGQSQEVKTGNDAFVAVDACDVLTQAAADQVMGTGSTKSDTSAGNASTDDISVSNCNYLNKPSTGSPLQDAQNGTTVGVLARAAKSAAGAESNKSVFGAQKPSGVQDLTGYGDKAFFNPQYGQVNILKGNNWYILSVKKGVDSRVVSTLDVVKPLADALKGNLR